MATATKKPSPPPSPASPASRPVPDNAVLRFCDAIYRFLASLKLAVICLASLAAALAYATFFEKWYGSSAVQEWIYQSKPFAILLAFLGMNILCAALIRFPWKRRQTGFVITHAGLLIVLAGSFWSLKTADEGQVGMAEGESRSTLLRTNNPVIRVWPLDPETHRPTNEEYRLPFSPGNFAWGPGQPRPRGFFGELAYWLTFGAYDSNQGAGEKVVLTGADDPIKLVVLSHIPAAAPTTEHVEDPAGIPMVKVHVQAKMPGQETAVDAFGEDGGDGRWLTPHSAAEVVLFRKLRRVVMQQGPARFAFLSVDRPELVDDFVNPPRDSGPAGVVRMRYRDNAGKARVHEWRLDDMPKPPETKEGHEPEQTALKTITLPDSDITASFYGVAMIPVGFEGLLGDSDIPVAHFKVHKANGPDDDYWGWAMMPMVPNLLSAGQKAAEPAVELTYYLPPTLGRELGRLGLIEILGTPDGKLYHRVFGRGKSENAVAEVRSVGPLTKGKEMNAFGGGANMPMTISFRVDEYLTAGREEELYVPVPNAKSDEGLAASRVAMTVKDGDKSVTKEFWIQRSPTEKPDPATVQFPSGDYQVAYDVDRRPLGCTLQLDDFKVGFDPGTQQAASFTSKVRLTDEAMGIKNKPHTIWMNHPLTHRQYTFYQSNYRRERDGRFQSIFQVGVDPGRPIKYLGCILVVIGAFVQFYMRAGLFSDGGKRERALAEAKAKKRDSSTNGTPNPARSDVDVVTESEETL